MTTLPPGVTRDRHASPKVTLETCHALKFSFRKADGNTSELIVWRDGPKNLRPADGKKLSDLRPGDEAEAFDKPVTIVAVAVYR